MTELLAGDEALHSYGPRFSCELTDLSAWSEATIKQKIALKVALYALHSVRDPRLGLERLPQMLAWLMQLTEEQSGIEYIQTLLVYLSAASPHLTEAEVQQALTGSLADEGGAIMHTLAEKWYEQGVVSGVEQGIEQGECLGAMRTLLDQLAYRFGSLEPALEARIRALTLSQIHVLSLFTLDATSIDQVADEVHRLHSG